MKNYDIEFVRGDTFSFVFEVEGLNENLTTAYFSCKEDPSNDAEDYKFQKKLEDGIEKINSTQYRVKIASGDTENLEVGLPYYYDLQININGDVLTPMLGKLTLIQDVTRGV